MGKELSNNGNHPNEVVDEYDPAPKQLPAGLDRSGRKVSSLRPNAADDLQLRLHRTRQHRIRQTVAALKQARLKRSLTIDDVAAASGVHKSVISRFENEAVDPHLATMLRYAEAVGTEFEIYVDGQPTSEVLLYMAQSPADFRPGAREDAAAATELSAPALKWANTTDQPEDTQPD